MSTTKKATKSGAAVKVQSDSWSDSFYRTEESFEAMMADVRATCAEVRAREEWMKGQSKRRGGARQASAAGA